MEAGPWLGDGPAGRLFDPVAPAASRAGVARARSSAFVVGNGVLEVGFSGVAGAGRERAVAVSDLDQVAEGVVGLVGVRLVGVVAREGGHLV